MKWSRLRVQSRYIFAVLITMVIVMLLTPARSDAQLKEMEIQSFNPEDTPIPLFTNYPEKAAIIVRSSMTNLQFESNLQIIAELGSPAQGEYILIVDPVVQSIRVSAAGYLTARIPIRGLTPRGVQYYTAEPKNQAITDKGTLVVQTVPEGATLELDGIPGTNISNHTYSDILAQTYILKVSLEDYQTEERLITVEPSRPKIERIELIPTFGYVTISTPNATLYLKDEESETEFRRSYTPSTPLTLDVGTWEYRLERQYFQDQSGTFTVEPGGISRLDVNLEPAYGVLRVESNVRNIRLNSPDNEAPPSNANNQINLENGLRTVVVSAPGYVSKEITVRIGAGQTLLEAVELETVVARDERLRKENLPKGILQVGADVDAEIYVNGELQGTGEVILTLIPDRYDVEFRLPVGTRKIRVNVAPSELSEQRVLMRPVRSRAIALSAFLPGTGHLYRKNSRGYLYLGLTAGAAAATFLAIGQQNTAQQDYDAAQLAYNLARSTNEATASRTALLNQYQSLEDAKSMVMVTAGVTAGLYALQLLDVMLTRPEYGFRVNEQDAVGVRIAPGGLTLTARF